MSGFRWDNVSISSVVWPSPTQEDRSWNLALERASISSTILFSVTHVTAIDCERMRPRQVEQRIDSAPVPITTMYRDASHGLLFPDESFDTVVTTWTLCSIHEVIPTLTEIRRVLRQNGSYLFLEHGPSDDPRSCSAPGAVETSGRADWSGLSGELT